MTSVTAARDGEAYAAPMKRTTKSPKAPKQAKRLAKSLPVAKRGAKPLPKAAPKPAAKAPPKPGRPIPVNLAAPPRWKVLTAGDIMQTRIFTVSDTAPLSEIERVLTENRISGVPVTNQAGKVIGVVSVRDLLARYVEDPDARPHRGGRYFDESVEELADEDLVSLDLPEESEETAADVMNPEVFHVPTSATLQEVARKMTEHRIHRVLVTDPADGRIVGILTTMGVLAAFAA